MSAHTRTPTHTRTPRGLTLRAAALGLAGGMRSMAPAAMLALSHGDTSSAAAWTRWPVLRSRWGRRVLILLGGGELIGDKLFGGTRTEVITRTATPDKVVAVAEDAACIGLLTAVARTRPA